MILTRTYERDYSGLVTKINRPGGRYTRYCYDKLGRVIRTDYYDKTYENFTYNKNGALIEVENQYGNRPSGYESQSTSYKYTAAWQRKRKKYNARPSAERSNKREKIDFKLESGRHRSTKMWYYVYFLYSYFQFRIIFTCQTSMPEFRWHNQSEFGDII